jgi:hypothetical protein
MSEATDRRRAHALAEPREHLDEIAADLPCAWETQAAARTDEAPAIRAGRRVAAAGEEEG